LESLSSDDLTAAAAQAENHQPISDHRVRELLKMISRIGSTSPGSDEVKSYYLAQLKSSIVFHGCPFLFFTINPGERHSPVALYYAGTDIDVRSFDSAAYSSSDRLKIMMQNPLAVVQYFHNMVRTIIDTCFLGGMFGDVGHYYGTIEYQGRGTPHIHIAVMLIFICL